MAIAAESRMAWRPRGGRCAIPVFTDPCAGLECRPETRKPGRMPDQPLPPYWIAPPGGLPPTAGRPLHWGGHSDPLFRIHFGNIALTVLTLGIYRFWGIVRIRRYAWSHTAFLGDRLEYTGTGGELLRGFLIVMAVILPLIVLASLLDVVAATHLGLAAAIIAVKLGVFLYLLAVGRHAARRYLASRTVWRGLRFAVHGSPWTCGRVQLGWWFATVLTLGLARPWAMVAEARWSFGRLHLGTQPFHFSGTASQLLRPWLVSYALALMGLFVLALVLSAIWSWDPFTTLPRPRIDKPGVEAMPEQVATLRIAMQVGLSVLAAMLVLPLFLLPAWFAFAAAAMRWRWSNLELGGARFAMPELGGGRLARLQLGNWFLMSVSFGLLYPLVVTRNARFLSERLWTDRLPDISWARQAADGRHNAEGLANVLDGGGAGIGI